MKNLITILLLTAITATAQEIGVLCTSNTFDKVISPLVYVGWGSDYHNQTMTNNVLYQFGGGSYRVAKADGITPVFLWTYSVAKSQRLSQSDKTYIYNLINDPQVKAYLGDDVIGWADQYTTVTTNFYPLPQQPTFFVSDKEMQNTDSKHFVSMFLPSVGVGKKSIIINNWLDLKGWDYTTENTNKVMDWVITDQYVLKANTNQAVYIIHKPAKQLPNATLQKRDDFRAELNEPVKATLGFMRMSQKREIMDKYGVQEK